MARVAYELSKGLVERGHDVTVYTTNRSKYDYHLLSNKPLSIDGMRIYYFENLRRLNPFQQTQIPPVPYYLPFIARKEVKEFDVIHIHGHRTLLEASVVHYAIKHNIPYILQAHGSMPFLSQHERLKPIFDKIYGNVILTNLTKAIALNQTESDQYVSSGVARERVVTLPNGLSSEFGSPIEGTFKKKYSLEADDRIVLYLGRIHQTKGLDELIKSFTIVNKKIKNSLLVLVGPDDGYRSHLEHLARNLNMQDRIRFIGFVSAEDKYSAYADSEVFVTPRFTGFPITFLEACANGLPIIATDIGDRLDWIDGNMGFVVENGDTQIASAIIQIMQTRTRDEYRRRGADLIKNKFNWKVIVNQLETIYIESVSHKM